jgi:hypothetical protein
MRANNPLQRADEFKLEEANMLSKILLVSAAASSLLLAQPQTASAATTVDVNIGSYPYYYPVQYGSPDYSGRSYPGDYGDEDEDQDRLTCWEGRRVVRRAGYYRVQTISCYGDIYRYSAVRRGFVWRISVDSDTGDIVRARRIRPVTYTSY